MRATEASEVLERFAAGAAPADVCTPEGRAMLRGAVRAYGAEMNANGVAWPAFGGEMRGMDASVLIAFAAGFVEASDFRGPARGLIGRLPFSQWPDLRDMRAAARVACAEVVDLQQAAARFVIETQRYEAMADGRTDGERLRRQERRIARAQARMHDMAATVQARLGDS